MLVMAVMSVTVREWWWWWWWWGWWCWWWWWWCLRRRRRWWWWGWWSWWWRGVTHRGTTDKIWLNYFEHHLNQIANMLATIADLRDDLYTLVEKKGDVTLIGHWIYMHKQTSQESQWIVSVILTALAQAPPLDGAGIVSIVIRSSTIRRCWPL